MKTIEEYKLAFALQDVIVPENEAETVVYGMLEEFANDKNSSKFREDVTKIMVGLRPSEGKLGYDDDFEPIEVKPINFSGKAKLAGQGNFSDFTWKRHRKYLADNVRMLVSGFYNGKLLYIAEFPYKSLQTRIEDVLTKKLPKGDVVGTYVRSAAFSYNHWMDKPYTVHYLRPTVGTYKKAFNKKFLQALTVQP